MSDETSSNGHGPLRAVPEPGTVPPGFTRHPVLEEPPLADRIEFLRSLGRDAEADALLAQHEAQQRAEVRRAEVVRLLGGDAADLLLALPDLFRDAIAAMVANGIAVAMQQVLPQVLGQVLPSIAPRPLCSTCTVLFAQWFATHRAELAAARKLAAAQAGIDADDPRAEGLDLEPFIESYLRPGSGDPRACPGINLAEVSVGGTGYCKGHHPQAPQASAGAGGLWVPGMPLPQPMPGVFAPSGR